ncbi:sensory neuron membrane protein 1-like, partial [Lucilia cuprina]|uniref:sensory neuron membrane protein 1-like n=1 Tax=Lucilia cuprina TaxID=7375 RepID=UPI001F0659A4
KNILILCSILVVVGIVAVIAFPKLMQSMIKKQINLKPNSETRQMWEKFPISIKFSIYVLNVTNHQEVEAGGKPKLQEVGPFVFDEWKDKYDVEDIEAEDAVEFNMRNTFIFRPDLGLSGEELIIMPHPLIQIMAISIKRDKAPMLKMITEGLEEIFKPQSAFIAAPFMDVFYRGFNVDCSSNNFAASAICLNFHTGNVKGGVQYNETMFKFSLLAASNHSDAGRFKVSRGIKNNRMLGQVLEFEGDEELNVWPGEECNKLKGTDSTIFAPLMKPSEGLWTFSPDLCRSLGPQYQKKVIYNGIPAFRYTMDFGDVKNEPENHCFCKDYPDNCPAKGTMDLSFCNETPMIASMPHFLNADPKLLEDVEGLQPDERKHGIYIDFEIISGTPLSIAKRLQFNLDVEPIEELPVMSKLKPLVMPLFWVEEAVDLDKSFTDLIKSKVFTTKKIVMVLMWNLVVIGLCGVIFAGVMLYVRKNDNMQVSDINSTVKTN